MEKIFNTIINSFIENKIGISNDFLSKDLSDKLRNNLRQHHLNESLAHAGTGAKDNLVHNASFRSDIIYWLDRAHNDVHENAFFDLMDSFIIFLNENCYTGITSYEFHYTLYEKESFYKKHIDQFKSNDSRKYSMIMYLNEDWNNEDGGELCIYHDERIEKISPVDGKSVFFKSSDLAHEVLVCNKPRMSITGWLKC